MSDLLHPDDEELLSRFLDVKNLGKQGIFVVRMKSTLAATVRSQEKVEYKVCIRGDVKDFIVHYAASFYVLYYTCCYLCVDCFPLLSTEDF